MGQEHSTPHDRAQTYLRESADITRKVAEKCLDSILAAANLIAEAFKNGQKILLFGNGGRAAQSIGMRTIGLAGERGELTAAVDVAICVPSSDTQHIQEAHIAIEHIICELVERSLLASE